MREIRLILNSDDFSAVSQTLIEMGIGFRVEPRSAFEAPSAETAASPAPTPEKPKGGKASKKPAAKPTAKRDRKPTTGAERLRSALSRNQPGGDFNLFRQPPQTPEDDRPATKPPPDES